ncbi:MAG: hypothetical protein D6819_09850, partial [Gammaproteobacteria bacterium]
DMAQAYAQATQALSPFWQRRCLAVALERALMHMGCCLLIYYEAHIEPPRGLWKAIHPLYLQALKTGIHTRQVKDSYLAVAASITPEDAYKRILLLSIADPFHLHRLDFHKLYKALEIWAGEVHLLHPDGPHPPKGFRIDPQSDAPPQAFSWKRPRVSGLTLDASMLVEKLAKDPGILTARSGETLTFPDHLRDTLIHHWQAFPVTREPRLRRDTPVSVAIGLTAIHRLLARPLPPANHTLAIMETDAHAERSTRPSADLESPPRILKGRIVDESSQGCRLRLEDLYPANLQVGEAISLHAQGRTKVGIIRWIKGSEMGIKCLSECPETAWIKRENRGISSPALWFRPSGQLLTLPLFRTGDVIELRLPQDTFKARLAERLEESYALKVFFIALLSETLNHPGHPDEALWSQLI